ncbi:MAG TPA: tyrosine-type recombinase/integrase [Longimicrobium sp.]|jgi:integrase|uniref:tyrosine-type recombinase/integrase n=1 Tax=Longimicrobium sp. TaxID=2029185 RepID=UPI002ED8DAA4
MAKNQTKPQPQTWSYTTGKKGANRIRVYEDGVGGPLKLEYFEPVFDNQGLPVIDPKTGTQQRKRERINLTRAGIKTRLQAMNKAEEVAKQFGEAPSGPVTGLSKGTGPLTLGKLFDLYFAEAVPHKKPDTQRQNDTDRRMFLAHFGRNAIVERIGPDGRPVTEMGRVRYNEFIRARKEGTIPGFPLKAKGQTLRNDIRFLRAVFTWAKVERDDGSVLLLRNPWEGFPLPPADTPVRQEMTKELHARLTKHAGNWRMAAVLDLCRETRRRMNSVRQLAISDIDLAAGLVQWQGEKDKVGKTRVTPLTRRAVEVIELALANRREEGLDGSPWLIPEEGDPTRPVRRSRLDNWMRATKKAQGLNIPRLGYHGEKRAGIRDPKFRKLDPAVQEELAGTTWETMRRVYDYVDVPTLREAVAALEGGKPGRKRCTRESVAA